MTDPTDKTVSEADESSEEVELSKETLEDLDAEGDDVRGGRAANCTQTATRSPDSC